MPNLAPATDDIASLLGNHSFFKQLAPEQLAQLAACAVMMSVPQGRLICSEGEPAEHFYVIVSGGVALEMAAPGREPLTVQTLAPGDELGLSWFYPPYRWHFDARALTATRLIDFNTKLLQTRLDADHTLGYEFVKRLAWLTFERLQATRLQLTGIYGGR